MKDYLVWVDCEMTGLDLEHDELVEVAALVTDGQLNVLGEGIDVVIKPSAAALEHMGDFVRTMHEHSGLLPELDGGTTLAEAEEQVLDYIRTFVPEPRRVPLAGNSIGTDRAFLAIGMPTLESYVHYRNVDVSSVKELARRWFPRAYYAAPAKTGNHRALADVQESIEELRYYRDAVFVPLPGPDSASARTDRRPAPGHDHRAPATPPPRPATPPRARRRNDFGARAGDHYTRRCAASRSSRTASRRLGGCSSVGRAPGCGPGGRGFKSRHSPQGKV